MVSGTNFLYLSRADVEAALPAPDELETAVETAFRGLGDGSAESALHSRIDPVPGTFFQAMPARVDKHQTVGMKWVCVAMNADQGRPDLPHINAQIILNDLQSAVTEAIMDGDLITSLRPSVVSLVGARRLARPDSRRIGFIACGVQARAHFKTLSSAFPLREATCYSRSLKTAEDFAAELRDQGIDARAVTDPRDAIQDQDIVVTSIPRSKGLVPYLEPEWASTGSCVIATDLARCWFPEHLRRMDLLATDQRTTSREAAAIGHIPWKGEFDTELSELISGKHAGRGTAEQRTFFIHPGLGVGDIAIATLVLARARQLGIGTRLSR